MLGKSEAKSKVFVLK